MIISPESEELSLPSRDVVHVHVGDREVGWWWWWEHQCLGQIFTLTVWFSVPGIKSVFHGLLSWKNVELFALAGWGLLGQFSKISTMDHMFCNGFWFHSSGSLRFPGSVFAGLLCKVSYFRSLGFWWSDTIFCNDHQTEVSVWHIALCVFPCQ